MLKQGFWEEGRADGPGRVRRLGRTRFRPERCHGLPGISPLHLQKMVFACENRTLTAGDLANGLARRRDVGIHPNIAAAGSPFGSGGGRPGGGCVLSALMGEVLSLFPHPPGSNTAAGPPAGESGRRLSAIRPRVGREQPVRVAAFLAQPVHRKQDSRGPVNKMTMKSLDFRLGIPYMLASWSLLPPGLNSRAYWFQLSATGRSPESEGPFGGMFLQRVVAISSRGQGVKRPLFHRPPGNK